MQELKDRIVKEGKVLPGNIIKVDGFLNHRIDTELMTISQRSSANTSIWTRSP